MAKPHGCCCVAMPRCCAAMGTELRAGRNVPAGQDWRPWFARSSLLRNDDVWLAVRAPGAPSRPACADALPRGAICAPPGACRPRALHVWRPVRRRDAHEPLASRLFLHLPHALDAGGGVRAPRLLGGRHGGCAPLAGARRAGPAAPLVAPGRVERAGHRAARLAARVCPVLVRRACASAAATRSALGLLAHCWAPRDACCPPPPAAAAAGRLSTPATAPPRGCPSTTLCTAPTSGRWWLTRFSARRRTSSSTSGARGSCTPSSTCSSPSHTSARAAPMRMATCVRQRTADACELLVHASAFAP